MDRDFPINSADDHRHFLSSSRPHILMVTHGTHEWDIIAGMPDTGGQNIFVNQLTDTLADFGFKVTIANRGGYTHARRGQLLRGINYKSSSCRILYLEDGKPEFVRKEDMHEQIPALVDDLERHLKQEEQTVSLFFSHYWDGADICARLKQRFAGGVPHVWIPHSLGAIKKRNMAESEWKKLRIDERIAAEKRVVTEVDGIASTSREIHDALLRDYGKETDLFLPPCVNEKRFYPHKVDDDHELWRLLASRLQRPIEDVRRAKIVTEISRTDVTKRKDVLIKAFSRAAGGQADTLLVVSIDEGREELHSQLLQLIEAEGIASQVAVVGSIGAVLPELYAATTVYCTPSVMEGFGMSIQEAAASGAPAVSSDLVPFAVEYLIGDDPQEKTFEGGESPARIGKGAVVVAADDVASFAGALKYLLNDKAEREAMGRAAHDITIPYFTWKSRVSDLLERLGTELPV